MYFRDISRLHMISFFYEMNECLRFYKPIPESFLIFRSRVLLKIKYLMSGGIFMLYWLFQVKVLKIIDKI